MKRLLALLKSVTCEQMPSHQLCVMVNMVHNIVRAIYAGEVSILVLLDLSAAFDIVDHDVLLDILQKRFEVECCVLDWLGHTC